MTVSDRVYEGFPVQLQTNDLRTYVDALGGMWQEMADIIEDGPNGEPGWSSIVDVDRCPSDGLPWLGQLVGATLPDGLSDAEQRDYIRAKPGWTRGSPQSLVIAAQLYLTGNKSVTFRERDPAACAAHPAYGLTIITKKSETPVEDWATTNICTNPSFETDLAGWTFQDSTGLRDSANFLYGSWSAKATSTGGANPAVYQNAVNLSGQTQGRQYTGSVWIKVPANLVGRQVVGYGYAAGGASANEYGPSTASIIADGSWQRLAAAPMTIQANDRTILGMVVYFNPNLTTGQFFNLDGAQLELNSKATPYTDTSRPAGQGPVGIALRSQKPAGIILRYDTLEGQDFQNLFQTSATFQIVYTKYNSFQGVLLDAPGT